MAYTIFNTRNNELAVVEDGTIDNTTDLKLIGKNYAGYGEIQNENFVYLLENFAGANQPPRPIAGQLWFDTSDSKIKVYDGNDEDVFVPLGNVHIGALPTGAAITAANVNKGDLWWDDVSSQLYVHNGATSGDPFVLVGPKGAQDVKTDIEDALVYDSLYAGQADPTPYQHRVLKGYLDDVVVFIASNDEFTLDDSNAISGFDRIKKGITLVNTENANDGVTSGNYSFHGSASNALRLGGTLAAEFVQRSNPVFVTEVNIDDNDGLLIGPNNEVLLKVSGNEGILESTITNAKFNFKVKDSGGSTVTPLTLTAAGPMPVSDNNFDIGSSSLRWNQIYATQFKGIADNADALLSDGTYKIATKNNTNDAIVTRDSVGDIYGTAFRGTALYNSTDAAAALTARVTRADSVLVDGTTDYVNATIASTANKLVLRDTNGQVFADQFNGLATRAARLQVSTGVDQYEYRSAAVADLAAAPNTVAVRDNNGKLYATEFVGSVNGESATASKWSTARTFTFDGDVSGSVTFDGEQDETVTLTVQSNRVALGTDTTGNYVNSVSRWNNDPYLAVYVNTELDGAGRENAQIQLAVAASESANGNSLVARNADGDITVEDIAAADITGDTITANTRFVGHVNDVSTTNDGYFRNLYCDNFTFSNQGTLGIDGGGTGATTAPAARSNLDIYSKGEVDGFISNLNTAISGVSTDSITSGSTNATVSSSQMTVTISGATHSTFNSNGIILSQGKFVGTATEAEYADLAEMYTTGEELLPGTVVMVCEHEGHELEACTETGYPVGVVSTDPAFLMNSDLENGTAIALKGRVPTRVFGAVKKGDLLFAGANGCAVTQGVYKVAVALESNADEGEKLVECMLVV
jgi:hypothetical protein